MQLAGVDSRPIFTALQLWTPGTLTQVQFDVHSTGVDVFTDGPMATCPAVLECVV